MGPLGCEGSQAGAGSLEGGLEWGEGLLASRAVRLASQDPLGERSLCSLTSHQLSWRPAKSVMTPADSTAQAGSVAQLVGSLLSTQEALGFDTEGLHETGCGGTACNPSAQQVETGRPEV